MYKKATSKSKGKASSSKMSGMKGMSGMSEMNGGKMMPPKKAKKKM